MKYCQTPLQLANPTDLQLDWEGVDFIFPCHKKKEGRRNNPHLAFSRRNGVWLWRWPNLLHHILSGQEFGSQISLTKLNTFDLSLVIVIVYGRRYLPMSRSTTFVVIVSSLSYSHWLGSFIFLSRGFFFSSELNWPVSFLYLSCLFPAVLLKK